MAEIVVAGELLAEFVAARRGQGFAEPGEFAGPFPSGAPAIFADQAARLGASVAYAGCVGRDAFGDAIVARLASHGVSTDAIRRVARPTGLAFVAYRDDGSRQFVYSIDGSASALREAADVTAALFEGCRYYHVMGSSLGSENAIAAVKRGVIEAARVGAKISFDPNVRAKMLAFKPMRAALEELLDACHLFLPSEADLPFFCGPQPAERAIRRPAGHPAAARARGAQARRGRQQRLRPPRPDRRRRLRDHRDRSDRRRRLLRRHPGGEPDPGLADRGGAVARQCGRRAGGGQGGPMEGNSSPAEIIAFLTERGIACPA